MARKVTAKPVGKVQTAIVTYLQQAGIGVRVPWNDMTRAPLFRGIHYERILDAIEALKKRGLIVVHGGTWATLGTPDYEPSVALVGNAGGKKRHGAPSIGKQVAELKALLK
jgi:hypothetical protein